MNGSNQLLELLFDENSSHHKVGKEYQSLELKVKTDVDTNFEMLMPSNKFTLLFFFFRAPKKVEDLMRKKTKVNKNDAGVSGTENISTSARGTIVAISYFYRGVLVVAKTLCKARLI